MRDEGAARSLSVLTNHPLAIPRPGDWNRPGQPQITQRARDSEEAGHLGRLRGSRAGRPRPPCGCWPGWAFAELGLARLEMLADRENLASQRVGERCGFRREGLLRSHMAVRNGRRDSVILGLLPGELRPG